MRWVPPFSNKPPARLSLVYTAPDLGAIRSIWRNKTEISPQIESNVNVWGPLFGFRERKPGIPYAKRESVLHVVRKLGQRIESLSGEKIGTFGAECL